MEASTKDAGVPSAESQPVGDCTTSCKNNDDSSENVPDDVTRDVVHVLPLKVKSSHPSLNVAPHVLGQRLTEFKNKMTAEMKQGW